MHGMNELSLFLICYLKENCGASSYYMHNNFLHVCLLLVYLMLWQAEISALVDALEQSACNPEVSSALAKCLLRILKLSAEKTIASFKAVNSFPRVLKVACIQSQESRRSSNIIPSVDSDVGDMVPCHKRSNSHETTQRWIKCMETTMELYMEFFSTVEDARNLVLHSSECIGRLFDLFWEEGLRNKVLKHILDLMKVFLILCEQLPTV